MPVFNTPGLRPEPNMGRSHVFIIWGLRQVWTLVPARCPGCLRSPQSCLVTLLVTLWPEVADLVLGQLQVGLLSRAGEWPLCYMVGSVAV